MPTSDKWLCVDGGTRIVTWIANEQLSGADLHYEYLARGITMPDHLKKFGRFISAKSQNIDIMSVYGRVGRDSENLHAALIRLPINIYINFLEDMTGTNDKREKTIPWGPDVPGRVGLDAVMSSYDYIGRLAYDSDGRLVGYFDARSPIYMARTREDRATGIKVAAEYPGFNLADFATLLSPATSDTLKICLYGKYGSMKTWQIGTLIQQYGAGNVWIISAERGLNTIGSLVREDRVKVVGSLDELRAAVKSVAEEVSK